MTEISIRELTAGSYSVKDNSPRGFSVKYAAEVKPGDYVVIANHFTLVVEEEATTND